MGKIVINTDGGARGNPGPAAAGFIIQADQQVIDQGGRYLGKATNNFAEYQAVNLAFDWLNKNAVAKKITHVDFYLDSELVTKQLRGDYKIKSPNILPLAMEIKTKERDLSIKVFYNYIPREKNILADAIVNKILDQHC